MNRLPKVLQNEIWEYVRGDRAYWKRIFSGQVCCEDRGECRYVATAIVPGGFIEVYYRSVTRRWWVRVFDYEVVTGESTLIKVFPPKQNIKDAMATFNLLKVCHKS